MKKTVKRVLSMMLTVAMCMGLAVNAMAVDKSSTQTLTNEQYEYELNAFAELYYVLLQRGKSIEAEGGNFIDGLSDYNQIVAAQSLYRKYLVNHNTVMSDAELFALLKDVKYVPKSENEYELKKSIRWETRVDFIPVCSGDDYTVKENWPKELQKYRPMGEAALISDTDDSDWENEAQSAAELLYRYGLFDGDENDDGTIDFHLNDVPNRIEAYTMWVDFWDKGAGLKYHNEHNVMQYGGRLWESNIYKDVSDAEFMNYIYFAEKCRGMDNNGYGGRQHGANNWDFESYMYRLLTGDGLSLSWRLSDTLIAFANDYGMREWLSDTEYLRYGDMALYALHSLTLKRADGELLVQNLVEHGQLTQAQADAIVSRVYLENPTVTATVSDFVEATSDEAADYLHELGLFGGVGTNEDGTTNYDLNRAPNRAEAITMLVRLLGKENEAKAGTWNIPFTDVPEWAVPYVGYAYANGLTGGISATEFGSTNTATQAQYLTFILRAMGYKDGEDFVWDRAWELSDKLGMTDSTKQSGDFLRGDVAVISLKALVATPKSGKNLASSLMDAGVFTVENAIASNLIQSNPINIPDMDITGTKKNEASTNDIQQNTTNNNTNVEYEDFTVTAINREAIGWKVTTTDLVIPETFVGDGKYGTTKGTHYRVTAIGDYAFAYCDRLTAVKIPKSVTIIDDDAFRDCKALTTIRIPNSVTTIGIYVFYGCTSLTTVEIPNSVKRIGYDPFGIDSPCPITDIYYTGSEAEWKQIEYYNPYREMNISELWIKEGANFHYNSTLPD